MTRRTSTIAKVTRPVFSGVCLRKKLFSRLDKARTRPVAWICGPPGAGKTILASSYTETKKLSCLWYRADSGDADPATFFYYMREAGAKASSGRKNPLPLFTPEYAHGVNVFSKRFFEELFTRLKSGSCLVIDNYQEVAPKSAFHEVVREGLSVLPEGMRAIIISRSGPPAAFAKLLASGSVEVIGPDELVLSAEESCCITKLKLGRKALRKGSDEIIRKANGWAAGLAIMLEEERSGGAGAHDEEIKGRLFDYFASEIFSRMDECTRSVLLKTSILNEFDAATAGRIAGIKEAGPILAELHKGNYFTERRLLARPVYQYHPLFREFLLEQLQKTYGTEAINQLRIRAAAALEELRQCEEAVELLDAAGDWNSLARILISFAPELMGQGRHQVLRQWLSHIPELMLKEDPWLLFWSGASALPADPVEARERLSAAYTLFKGQENVAGLYLSWSAIADTFFFEWKNFRPLDGWIKELNRVREKFPKYPSEEIEERVVSGMFGALVFRQPQNPRIASWEERVREIFFRTRESSPKVLIGNNLIFYYLWTGRYAKAKVVIESLSSALDAGGPDLPRIMWCIVNALYEFHTSNYDESLAWVDKGLKISEASGIHLLKSKLFGLGSFASIMAQRDIRQAEAYSRGMSQSMNRENCFDLTYCHQQASRIALAKNDMSAALENIRVASDYAERLGAPFLQGMAETIFFYYLVEAGETVEAKKRLGRLRGLARETGSLLFDYIRFMTEALYYLNGGKERECVEALAKSLAIGRKNGIRYLNIIKPETSARLLAKAIMAGVETHFAKELIRSNSLVCPDPEIEDWPWQLRVRTLGSFETWREEEKIRFTRKAQQKPFDLLKAVITLGGKSINERLITDMLWPDAEGDAAHSAFATTLHRLRQLIGCDRALELKDGKLTLDGRYCWVDLWALEAALKRVEGHLKAGCAGDALKDMDRALELYRGDFLSADADILWTVQARDRVKDRLLKALGEISIHLISQSKADAADEFLGRGLAIDECNEGLCQRLLGLYVDSGRRREALGLFEKFKKALAAKVGVEPAPATKAIIERLIENHSNM